MRILVTGHEGYIGSILAPRLLDVGHSVVGCDAGWFRGCDYVGALADVENIGKDIRRLAHQDFEGFDAVVHLAGLSNDPLGNYRPGLTASINHRAAVDAARLARDAGVERFVFASSCSIYGASGASGASMLTERSPTDPLTPYAESKLRAEEDIGALASDTFSPTFLRAGTVYGVAPRIRFDLVLNNLAAWAAATGRIHLKSDGSAWRPLIHVEDLADTYVAVLNAPRENVHAQAFNVGLTEENHRVRELADFVKLAAPEARIDMARSAEADRRNYRVDCAKIRSLGITGPARWNVRTGSRQLVDTLCMRPVAPEDFEGPRFARIAHLKQACETGRLDENLFIRD